MTPVCGCPLIGMDALHQAVKDFLTDWCDDHPRERSLVLIAVIKFCVEHLNTEYITWVIAHMLNPDELIDARCVLIYKGAHNVFVVNVQ